MTIEHLTTPTNPPLYNYAMRTQPEKNTPIGPFHRHTGGVISPEDWTTFHAAPEVAKDVFPVDGGCLATNALLMTLHRFWPAGTEPLRGYLLLPLCPPSEALN